MKYNFFSLLTAAILVFFMIACNSSKNSSDKGSLYNNMQLKESPAAAEGMTAESAPSMNVQAEMKNEEESVSDGKKTDEYNKITENTFSTPETAPLSTFSIDVDNASYTNVRAYLQGGTFPHPDMVRTEEFINYFDYDYPAPSGDEAFAVHTDVCKSPWNEAHKLVRIALQGKKIDKNKLAPANLVFLIDASGSMEDANKLPLLKSSLKVLLNNLNANDKISIVAYAGVAGLILEPTPATEKEKILDALDNLKAGGSTAGGEGILLAYKIAKQAFIPKGNNRVILATDGDFNVGVSSTAELTRLLEEKKKDGIYLTICGLGMGNYKDSRMKSMASVADGNYYYIDNMSEANRIFGQELRATLFTIAKDVKIQVEFNPQNVQAYRLIGYESRLLKSEDFNDDTKDAGELGAGHRVTALYEIIPHGVSSSFIKKTDALKYQKSEKSSAGSKELLTVKLRYKKPGTENSLLITREVTNSDKGIAEAEKSTQFAAAVAAFAQILRKSEFKQNASYEMVTDLAKAGLEKDEQGFKAEFLKLVEYAKATDSKK